MQEKKLDWKEIGNLETKCTELLDLLTSLDIQDNIQRITVGCKEIKHNIPIEGLRYFIKPVEPVEEINFEEVYTYDEDKKTFNEGYYCDALRRQYGLVYDYGVFYCTKGDINTREGDMIKQIIANDLIVNVGMTSAIDSKVRHIYELLCIVCSNVNQDGTKIITTSDNVIPLANGDYYVNERVFIQNGRKPSKYRLGASLLPNYTGTPLFDDWINNVVFDYDHRVLKAFLGYLLVPNTKGQKSLFLIGQGRIGKSSLGNIITNVLGSASYRVNNMASFLNDKFALVNSENKLALYDDDIGKTPLASDNLFKTLVTNTGSISVERKGKDSRQAEFFARFIVLGNYMLEMPNDCDKAYVRRFLPIFCKPRSEEFVPDVNFPRKLRGETDMILVVMLQGLYDLISIDYDFDSITSESTKDWENSVVEDVSPIEAFYKDSFTKCDDCFISHREIIDEYKKYCKRNNIHFDFSSVEKDVKKWFRDNMPQYNIKSGKKFNTRGYIGLRFKTGE